MCKGKTTVGKESRGKRKAERGKPFFYSLSKGFSFPLCFVLISLFCFYSAMVCFQRMPFEGDFPFSDVMLVRLCSDAIPLQVLPTTATG